MEGHKEKVLSKLYSARLAAPIADRRAPTFESGPAFRKVSRGLSEAGFRPLTDRGELASLPAAEPEDSQRKVFVRRPSTADPTEMVTVDWSGRRGEIHPLEDISSPKPLLRMSPAYLRPPGTEDIGGTGTEHGTRATKKEPTSTQVFLPYYDPVKDRSGWQLGLPPREGSQHPHMFSARILTREGRVLDVKHLRLKRNKTSPSEPVWGWVPAPSASTQREVCLSPPEKGPGSQPLSLLGRRGADRMLTPAGIKRAERGRKPTDYPQDIYLPSVSSGSYGIRLGAFEICTAEVRNETLTFIQPSGVAHKLELWTCHLAQIATTRLLCGNPL